MSYFKFTNEQEAEKALDIVNQVLELPINWANGAPINQNEYFIEKWNNKRKASGVDIWFFQIPQGQFATKIPAILEEMQNNNINYEISTTIPDWWISSELSELEEI